MSKDNGAKTKTWICNRCGKEQPGPKPHPTTKYCPPCKPLAKAEQIKEWAKAHPPDYRSYRKQDLKAP